MFILTSIFQKCHSEIILGERRKVYNDSEKSSGMSRSYPTIRKVLLYPSTEIFASSLPRRFLVLHYESDGPAVCVKKREKICGNKYVNYFVKNIYRIVSRIYA